MKKYKIYLGGRGTELYIHNINEEQKQSLKEMDVENENVSVDWDRLNNILNVESWDYSDEVYIGAYPQPSAYIVSVYDENEQLVWESDNDYFLNEGSEDEDYVLIEKENILLIEHYVKGGFYEYILETEDDFDPEKLSTKIVEINETISVLVGLNYEDKPLEVDEYGDNWSKNTIFYIF